LDCPIVSSTDISETPCPEPIGAADVRLRILSLPARNGFLDTAYGFAVVPALASVYYESVMDFAKYDQTAFELPVVLGCAIVHEIGHLLLGSNSHSAIGVMCAHWERKHIREALMGAMVFTPEQARLMQAEMRRRMASEIIQDTTVPNSRRSPISARSRRELRQLRSRGGAACCHWDQVTCLRDTWIDPNSWLAAREVQ
jgi:hypothetical protein